MKTLRLRHISSYQRGIRQPQWPRGLRRGSAAALLLGLWVRIPRGHGCQCLVSVVCCQVEVSARG